MIYRDEANGSSSILISDLSVKLSLYKGNFLQAPVAPRASGQLWSCGGGAVRVGLMLSPHRPAYLSSNARTGGR